MRLERRPPGMSLSRIARRTLSVVALCSAASIWSAPTALADVTDVTVLPYSFPELWAGARSAKSNEQYACQYDGGEFDGNENECGNSVPVGAGWCRSINAPPTWPRPGCSNSATGNRNT
jgi:hypothetical protein